MLHFTENHMRKIAGIVLLSVFCLSGCDAENNISEEMTTSASEETSQTVYSEVSETTAVETENQDPEEAAQKAYFDFLSGDISLLEDKELGQEWVDFYLPNSELEYVFLDLDGDDISELLVQYVDSPEILNAVFHYSDGKLFCWNFDSAEGSCRDYPLKDYGIIVRQYDFNGTRSYTVFRYISDGNQMELFNFFVRDELINENDTSPVPYYEVDGYEVEQEAFEAEFEKRITSQIPERSFWTAVSDITE